MRATRILLQTLDRHVSSRASTIGFIGLGRMGSQMAENLFSKQMTAGAASPSAPQFLICDAVERAANQFATDFSAKHPSARVSVCRSPGELASSSSTVITMLPSTKEVQEVYLGAGGILASTRELSSEDISKTTLIDCTTLAVDAAQAVAKSVHEAGASMVDAPVSGGVTGAKAGTLSFLVGGQEATFHQVSKILALMGQRIIYCGPSGSGLAAKICNNLMLGVQQIVTAEAMLLGQQLGLDPAILASVINSSTGSCWSSSVNNPIQGALPDKSPPCDRDFDGGFATALMYKDMGLASDIASKTNVPIPLGAVAQSIYEKAMAKIPELARKDFSSIYKYLQEGAL